MTLSETLQANVDLHYFLKGKHYLSNIENFINVILKDDHQVISDDRYGDVLDFINDFKRLFYLAVEDHSLREFLMHLTEAEEMGEVIIELVNVLNENSDDGFGLKSFYDYFLTHTSCKSEAFFAVLERFTTRFKASVISASEESIDSSELKEFLERAEFGLEEGVDLIITPGTNIDFFHKIKDGLAGMADFEGVVSPDGRIIIRNQKNILLCHNESGWSLISLAQIMDHVLFALALDNIKKDNPLLLSGDLRKYVTDFLARYKFGAADRAKITEVLETINVEGPAQPLVEFIKARDIGFNLQDQLLKLISECGAEAVVDHLFGCKGVVSYKMEYGGIVFTLARTPDFVASEKHGLLCNVFAGTNDVLASINDSKTFCVEGARSLREKIFTIEDCRIIHDIAEKHLTDLFNPQGKYVDILKNFKMALNKEGIGGDKAISAELIMNCFSNTMKSDGNFNLFVRHLVRKQIIPELFLLTLNLVKHGRIGIERHGTDCYFTDFLQDILSRAPNSDVAYGLVLSLYEVSRNPDILRLSKHPLAEAVIRHDYAALTPGILKVISYTASGKFYNYALKRSGATFWSSPRLVDKAGFILDVLGVDFVIREGRVIITNSGNGKEFLRSFGQELGGYESIAVDAETILMKYATIRINGIEAPFLMEDVGKIGYFSGCYFPLFERDEMFRAWNAECLHLRAIGDDEKLFDFRNDIPPAMPQLNYGEFARFIGSYGVCENKEGIIKITLTDRRFHDPAFVGFPYIESDGDASEIAFFKTKEKFFNKNLFLAYNKSSQEIIVTSDILLLQKFLAYVVNLEQFAPKIAMLEISAMASNFMDGYVVDLAARNHIIAKVLTAENIRAFKENPEDFVGALKKKLDDEIGRNKDFTVAIKNLFMPEQAGFVRTVKYLEALQWEITYKDKLPSKMKEIKGLRFYQENHRSRDKKTVLKVEIEDYLEFYSEGYKQIVAMLLPSVPVVGVFAEAASMPVADEDWMSKTVIGKPKKKSAAEIAEERAKIEQAKKDAAEKVRKDKEKALENKRKADEAAAEEKRLRREKQEEAVARKLEKERITKLKQQEEAEKARAKRDAEAAARKLEEAAERERQALILQQQEEVRRLAAEAEVKRRKIEDEIDRLQKEVMSIMEETEARQTAWDSEVLQIKTIIDQNTKRDLELQNEESQIIKGFDNLKKLFWHGDIKSYEERHKEMERDLTWIEGEKLFIAEWASKLGLDKSLADFEGISNNILTLRKRILYYAAQKFSYLKNVAQAEQEMQSVLDEFNLRKKELMAEVGAVEYPRIKDVTKCQANFKDQIEILEWNLEREDNEKKRKIISLNIEILNLKIIQEEQKIQKIRQDVDLSREKYFVEKKWELNKILMGDLNRIVKSGDWVAIGGDTEQQDGELRQSYNYYLESGRQIISSVNKAVAGYLQENLRKARQHEAELKAKMLQTKGEFDLVKSELDGRVEGLERHEAKVEDNFQKFMMATDDALNLLREESEHLQYKISSSRAASAAGQRSDAEMMRDIIHSNNVLLENIRVVTLAFNEQRRQDISKRQIIDAEFAYKKDFAMRRVVAKLRELGDLRKEAIDFGNKEGLSALERELKKTEAAIIGEQIRALDLESKKEVLAISFEEISKREKLRGQMDYLQQSYIAFLKVHMAVHRNAVKRLLNSGIMAEENARFLELARVTELAKKRSLYYKVPPAIRLFVDELKGYFEAKLFMHGSIFYKDNPQDTDWQLDLEMATFPKDFVTVEKIIGLFPALEREAIEIKEIARSSGGEDKIIAFSIKIKAPDNSTIIDLTLCSKSYNQTITCAAYYDSVRMDEDGKFHFKDNYNRKFQEINGVAPSEDDSYPFHGPDYHRVIDTGAFQFYLRGAYLLLSSNKALTDEGREAVTNGIGAVLFTAVLQNPSCRARVVEVVAKFIEDHKIKGEDVGVFMRIITEGLDKAESKKSASSRPSSVAESPKMEAADSVSVDEGRDLF